MMKVCVLFLLAALPALSQFGDARSLQHQPIKPGMTCASDAYVLTWVTARNQFECLAASGAPTGAAGGVLGGTYPSPTFAGGASFNADAATFLNGAGSFTSPGTANARITFSNVASATMTLTGVAVKAVVTCWDSSVSPARLFIPDSVEQTDADTLTFNFSPNATGYCDGSTGVGATGAAGAAGSSAFSALTSSTNSTAAMVVGTGASLSASGSGAITATKLGSGSYIPILASGAPSAAVAADIVGLFSTCSGTQYLGADGACHNNGGSGTVTSIATTAPITGGTITGTGTIACATCGVTGSPLSQFAATTSAQLRSTLSDESGTGLAYFQGGDIGTPSAGVGTNFTGIPAAAISSGTIATARLGSGSATAGTFLQGDQSWAAISTAYTVISGVPANSLLGNNTGSTANAISLTALPFAFTGDVTLAANATATVLANIPSATPMAGSLLATAIAVPSTPAAGRGSLYVDSTSKNIAIKDDAGVVKHGVQTNTGAANNFLTAISDAGVVSRAQPAFTDLSGTATAAQLPSNQKIRGPSATFAGALAPGQTVYYTNPYACSISAYNIVADAGTATVKLWRLATGTAIPTVSNSISTNGVSLATGTAIHSTTVSDFTSTAISANDILGFNLFAVSGASYVNIVLQCDAT